MTKIEDKIAELKTKLGDEELVGKVLAGVVDRQKEAEKAGIAFKGKKFDSEVELSDEAEAFIATVTKEVLLEEKKADKKAEDDEEEMPPEEGGEEAPPEKKDEEDEEEGKEIDNPLEGLKSIMEASPSQFLSIMTQALSDSISPYLAEVKQLREAVENSQSTKELESTKELLGKIEKSLESVNSRLDGLEGDVPRAAKEYIASKDDKNVLDEKEKEEMKKKGLLASEKSDAAHENGFDEFADFVMSD